MNPGSKAEDTVFGNNTFGVPGFTQFQPDYTLQDADFPFHVLNDPEEANFDLRNVLQDTNDVASSMGVFAAKFTGVVPGSPFDVGVPYLDPVFNLTTPAAIDVGANVRRVEPRHTPTVINAVFNFTNFSDGRAHNLFNGETVIGPLDSGAGFWLQEGRALVKQTGIQIDNSSLASQAVGPPLSDLEMSFTGRPFPLIGRKLFGLTPLGQQEVDATDSVLGSLSNFPAPGISATYQELIKAAFRHQYWNSKLTTPEGYTQMEANFSLFFGLAVQMYESTLVSDQTPFDAFMAGDNAALTQEQLRGLLTFINFGAADQLPGGAFGDLFAGVSVGSCIPCHFGPELTSSSVSVISLGQVEVDFVPDLVDGLLVPSNPEVLMFQDEGSYNIGVRPSDEDLGRGNRENGIPLSFVGQAQEGFVLPFAVLTPDPEFPGAFPEDNISTRGKFKVPGLRNVELTGPYFHNGGMATLAQVIEFYDRRGDFSNINLADVDGPLSFVTLGPGDEEALIALMLAFTDERVRNEMAPFDHPQIIVPNGGTFGSPAPPIVVPAVGAGGRPDKGFPPLGTFLGLNPFN